MLHVVHVKPAGVGIAQKLFVTVAEAVRVDTVPPDPPSVPPGVVPIVPGDPDVVMPEHKLGSVSQFPWVESGLAQTPSKLFPTVPSAIMSSGGGWPALASNLLV